MNTAIKERPVIFSAPMVQAILVGRKTQTRRIIKPQPELIGGSNDAWQLGEYVAISSDDMKDHLFHNVYGVKGTPYGCLWEGGGDRLWVREKHRIVDDPAAYHVDDGKRTKTTYECPDALRRGPNGERLVVDYAADGPHTRMMDKWGKPEWKSPIFMPRLASRITLEITDVRVERLNDISEADAMAEGVERIQLTSGILPDVEPPFNRVHPMTSTYKDAFTKLWQSINGADSWDANPWVWAISFRRLTNDT